MKFILKENRLETDEGKLIKVFDCPLEKKWDELLPWYSDWINYRETNKRYCGSCKKAVVNFQEFNEDQIKAIVKINPDTCGHLELSHPDLTEVIGSIDESFVNMHLDSFHESSCIRTQLTRTGERIVKTARILATIREGISRGFRPFFVINTPMGLIHQRLAIIYNKETRMLMTSGDLRDISVMSQDQIDERFGKGSGIYLDGDIMRDPSPIAAYLLHETIKIGEKVYLEDLIEDRIEMEWNQGNTYRAKSGYAIWRGENIGMEIIDNPNGPCKVLG